MPLYEEKLISPLALRFTQAHIRSTFRDGRDVAATIGQIEHRPGVQEYDVVLHAPFPHIEIIRCSPHQRKHGSSKKSVQRDDQQHKTCTEEHWFTFDNRRLYCLQKAAIALWPKRVAAVVEVLYADSGALRRKYDSETYGLSVDIRHSTDIYVGTWSWQKAVSGSKAINTDDIAAFQAVADDDAKKSMDALEGVPQEPSLLEAFFGAAVHDSQALECRPTSLTERDGDRNVCSTTASLTDSPGISDESDLGSPRSAVQTGSKSKSGGQAGAEEDEEEFAESHTPDLEQLKRNLSYTWVGIRGETYCIDCEKKNWSCTRWDAVGYRRYTLVYDSELEIVWWGLDQKYFFSPWELASKNYEVRWYSGSDLSMQRSKFTWHKYVEKSKSWQEYPQRTRYNVVTQSYPSQKVRTVDRRSGVTESYQAGQMRTVDHHSGVTESYPAQHVRTVDRRSGVSTTTKKKWVPTCVGGE